MPLYDFRCGECGEQFEALVQIGDSPECPACGASEAERLFSSTFSTPKKYRLTGSDRARSDNARRATRDAAREQAGRKRELKDKG